VATPAAKLLSTIAGLFVAGHLQTFTDRIRRARIVPAVSVGEVSDKLGVSTDRQLDAKFLAFFEELRFLQTSRTKQITIV